MFGGHVASSPLNRNIMSNVCIITDSTAQFTQANFPGHERVYVIPFDIQNTAAQEDETSARRYWISTAVNSPYSTGIHPILCQVEP